jgi:predicted RNA-binding protein
MKMTSILSCSAVILSAMSITADADQAAARPVKEKEFEGKVVYVNAEEHTLTVRDWLRHRTFDLGGNCAITRWDNTAGAVADLRPGEKVTVGYQNAHGVLAADRVTQEAMRFRGVVKAIEPEHRELVMGRWDHDKTFKLAQDCKVVLHNQANGDVAEIKPGDHITLVYETPAGPDVAYQIMRTSANFTGALVAIDMPHRTVCIEDAVSTRQFSLASDCSIVASNTTDAPMADLRPGERLTISYDKVNGVNVANRIAPAAQPAAAATAEVYPY